VTTSLPPNLVELRDRRAFVIRLLETVAATVVVGPLATLGCASASSSTARPPCFGCARASPPTAKVNVSRLTQDGEGLLTSYSGPDGGQIMIVRQVGGELVALSTRCTHEGCKVNMPTGGRIPCPCHGSVYALNGKVLQGPTTHPLPSYPVVAYDQARKQVTIKIQ
jgi:Rieske Fe-S protein